MSGAYLEKEMTVLDFEPLKVIAEVVYLREKTWWPRKEEKEKKIYFES